MTRLTTSTALLVGVICLVALTTTTQLVAATNTLIMSGLNSPRGLALGPDGGIYVAEAGAGGAGPCQIAPTTENRCFGLSGAISRFLNGVQQRVVVNLPSHALPGGDAAAGPNDIAFQGSAMFVMIGFGFDVLLHALESIRGEFHERTRSGISVPEGRDLARCSRFRQPAR